MKTKENEPATSPKERGLNSDEQKRKTNRPVPEFPDGTETDTDTEQESEKDTSKKYSTKKKKSK